VQNAAASVFLGATDLRFDDLSFGNQREDIDVEA
jgi:hypothetical protein